MITHLFPILQAGQPPDEFGSPFVLFLFLVLVGITIIAAVGVAAVTSGVILAGIGALALAAVVVGSLLAAVFCLHVALATMVWTRRPRADVLMARGWWGLLTLCAGLFAAIPFWWLHYVRSAQPRRA